VYGRRREIRNRAIALLSVRPWSVASATKRLPGAARRSASATARTAGSGKADAGNRAQKPRADEI